MLTLEQLTNLAKGTGRKDLYIYAIGDIRGTMKFSSDENKVQEIEQVLNILDQLLNDESIPWDIKVAPLSEGATEENELLEFTTFDDIEEAIPMCDTDGYGS